MRLFFETNSRRIGNQFLPVLYGFACSGGQKNFTSLPISRIIAPSCWRSSGALKVLHHFSHYHFLVIFYHPVMDQFRSIPITLRLLNKHSNAFSTAKILIFFFFRFLSLLERLVLVRLLRYPNISTRLGTLNVEWYDFIRWCCSLFDK